MRSYQVFCLVVLSLLPFLASAHEIRPAIASINFQDNGSYTIFIKINAESLLAKIGKEHQDTDDSPNAERYNYLRSLEADKLSSQFAAFAPEYINELTLKFDRASSPPQFNMIEVPEIGDTRLSRTSVVSLTGKVPDNSKTFQWAYPKIYGDCVLKISINNSQPVSFWLTDGELSEPLAVNEIAPRSTTSDTVTQYTILGFQHIVPKGVDHILFVLGIFLLSLHWRPLLYQVTAFTVAHTITLGLSIYGVISLSPAIVEPLIALSIVYVAAENIISPKLQPWRIFLVFCFGLLHGLGFAGVLQELGLPNSEYLTALLSFNIGVELGQLAVIIIAYGLVARWSYRKDWYRHRVVIPGSIAIAITGAYWTVERITF